MTIQELQYKINENANTYVTMSGEIDSNGQYSGHLRGSSTDELYEFVKYIAETRGEAFEQVGFRYGGQNPETYTCYITFDTADFE